MAECLAWAALLVLAGAALLIVNRLGFLGLGLLGLLTWFVCTMMALNEDVPTWGEHVFRARMTQRARGASRDGPARDSARFVPDVVFYRRCGMGLAAAGAAGFVWQVW